LCSVADPARKTASHIFVRIKHTNGETQVRSAGMQQQPMITVLKWCCDGDDAPTRGGLAHYAACDDGAAHAPQAQSAPLAPPGAPPQSQRT
jgi:hypothetical protein